VNTSDLSVRRRLGALSATALAVLVVTGCGSSSPSHTNTTGTGTSTQPATTNTVPATNAAEDGRIARDAQLKLTDFPAGWEQQDSATESNSEAHCEGVDAAKAAVSARQTSPDFARASTDYAHSFTYVYVDVARASQAFSQLASESTRTCLGEQLAKYLETQKKQGATIGKITTSQVSMTPVGDEHAESRLTIPVSAQGVTASFYVDLVFVRVGRGIAGFTLQSLLSPFRESLSTELAKTVVDRLKAGLEQAA